MKTSVFTEGFTEPVFKPPGPSMVIELQPFKKNFFCYFSLQVSNNYSESTWYVFLEEVHFMNMIKQDINVWIKTFSNCGLIAESWCYRVLFFLNQTCQELWVSQAL